MKNLHKISSGRTEPNKLLEELGVGGEKILK
jgi:hypothetical protein